MLINYVRQLIFGRKKGGKHGVRDHQTVSNEYESAWARIDFESYQPGGQIERVTPWTLDGKRTLASDIGSARFRQLMLIKTIEHCKPSSILEIGCGNGVNLLLLACRFPEIEFTGLELTTAGRKAAEAFQAEHEQLPVGMQEFAPEPLPDPAAFRRIKFVQGNAAELPFDENSFDFVQTVLALEQMETIRPKALSEMARVARQFCFNIEPFRDVNYGGLSRMYIIRRHYFAGLIDDLKNYSLEPQWATADFPQEQFLKSCAVLSQKQA